MQGLALLFGTLVLLINFAVDIALGVIDPRSTILDSDVRRWDAGDVLRTPVGIFAALASGRSSLLAVFAPMLWSDEAARFDFTPPPRARAAHPLGTDASAATSSSVFSSRRGSRSARPPRDPYRGPDRDPARSAVLAVGAAREDADGLHQPRGRVPRAARRDLRGRDHRRRRPRSRHRDRLRARTVLRAPEPDAVVVRDRVGLRGGSADARRRPDTAPHPARPAERRRAAAPHTARSPWARRCSPSPASASSASPCSRPTTTGAAC